MYIVERLVPKAWKGKEWVIRKTGDRIHDPLEIQ